MVTDFTVLGLLGESEVPLTLGQIATRLDCTLDEVADAISTLSEKGLVLFANTASPKQMPHFMYSTPRTRNGWVPTAENINSLPEPVRKYIHDLGTMCDPSGIIRENAILRDHCTALETLVLELKEKLNAVK